VGVNFDPANMILYGMGDPVESLRALMPHVMQVHLKDATPSATPGQWGAEVPLGAGAVDWSSFFATLRAAGYAGDLCIEREAGEQRIEDIRTALALASRFVG
ncbi:MAG: sugar phosphate isomerase/epimerase family protein, partial [Phycisphaerales bacterium]